MKIHHDFSDYSIAFPVITTGVFDGVHAGHHQILQRLCTAASERKGESVVLTFWPHPRQVIYPQEHISLINTLEEKLILLEHTGIQHVVIIPFNKEFAELTSRQFIEEILVNKMQVKHLIVGFNHHFGKNREGNFMSIQQYANQFKFTIEQLDAKMIADEKISSTRIRNALMEGDILTANKYLGYTYFLKGTVVLGDQLGRKLGYPTANIYVPETYKLIPKAGVYAVEVVIQDRRFSGMLNMGYRPTLQNKIPSFSIEVHIFDFSEDIYNKQITLLFRKRIRDEKRFESIDQLKEQLDQDKKDVRNFLGE